MGRQDARPKKKWGDEMQDKIKIGRQDAKREKMGRRDARQKKNWETRRETKKLGDETGDEKK